MSTKRAKLLVAGVWVLSFVICLPQLVGLTKNHKVRPFSIVIVSIFQQKKHDTHDKHLYHYDIFYVDGRAVCLFLSLSLSQNVPLLTQILLEEIHIFIWTSNYLHTKK